MAFEVSRKMDREADRCVSKRLQHLVSDRACVLRGKVLAFLLENDAVFSMIRSIVDRRRLQLVLRREGQRNAVSVL